MKVQLSAAQNVQAEALGLSMALTFVPLHKGIDSLFNFNNMTMCCPVYETVLNTLVQSPSEDLVMLVICFLPNLGTYVAKRK